MVSRQKITKGMLMKCRLCLIAIMCVGCWGADLWAIGETAVITLAFPYGARQVGMGEVGVTLADDESATYWNPAGLGIRNERWEAGAVMVCWEPVLSVFGFKDFWHFAGAGCYQHTFPDHHVFGVGTSINYLALGVNDRYNESGELVGTMRSYENVVGRSFGVSFFNRSRTQHGFGASIKYVYSALAPGFGPNGEGVGKTFAVDVGYLCVLPFGMRIGATFLNMGPDISYISRDEEDPIPFTARVGLGFKRDFGTPEVAIARVSAEYSINREFAKRDTNTGKPYPFYKALFTDDHFAEELIHNTGCEIRLFRTGAARIGFLYDDAGSRTELHWGFGVSVFNHFDWDVFIITSPSSSIARARSWGFSFSFWNMFNFKPADLQWWRKAG
jgi:hypothetical protein